MTSAIADTNAWRATVRGAVMAGEGFGSGASGTVPEVREQVRSLKQDR